MGKILNPQLTDMQQRFVEHYLVTLNSKQSAILAGYSEATAMEQGYQLLQHASVSKALRKAMSRRAKRLELSADNVLREIAKIAFSDIRAVVEFDGEEVKFKPSKKIHSDAAAAIQSISSDTKIHKDREGNSERTITLKIKLHDKMRALDMAGRHLGLWKELDDDSIRKMTTKELVVLVKEKLPELEAMK